MPGSFIHTLRELVRARGGRIDRMHTRYAKRRGGRVIEVTIFLPGTTGYDEATE